MIGRNWCVWSTSLLSFLLLLPSAQAQDATRAQRLSTEVSALLQARVEQARKSEFPPISAGDLPSLDTVEITHRRLHLWAETWIGSMTRSASLTDSQAGNLRESAHELISLEVRKYAQTPYLHNFLNHARLNEDFPVHLMLQGGTGHWLRGQLENLSRHGALTSAQAAAVNQAMSESAEFENSALMEFLIASLDAELFLSPQQQADIRDHVRLERGLQRDWLMTFDPSFNRYQGVPVALLYSANLSSTLLPIQTSALEIMRRGDYYGISVFNYPMAHGDWLKGLDEATNQYRMQTQLIAEVRLHYYSRELGFPEASLSGFKAAAAEVATELAEKWQTQLFARMLDGDDDFHRAGGLFSSKLESDSRWDGAFSPELQRLRQWDAQRRSAQMRMAMAKVTLALLDQELVLTPAQRELLLPAVEKSFPAGLESKSRNYFSAVIWLPYPLHQIPAPLVSAVLTPEQLAQWETLKCYYWPDERTVYQYLAFKGRFAGVSYRRQQ